MTEDFGTLLFTWNHDELYVVYIIQHKKTKSEMWTYLDTVRGDKFDSDSFYGDR